MSHKQREDCCKDTCVKFRVGKPNSIIPGLVDEPWNKAKIHNRTGDVEAYVGYKW